MNRQGRESSIATPSSARGPATISGDRGLDHEEGLIFELGRAGMTGVDVPEVQMGETRLAGKRRKGPVGLPGLSEPEVIRHYVRLSRMNYAIDAGLYPLGSCTMKHNPRLNEKMARLPGFGDVHPLQPQQTVQGALALIAELMRWLTTLTGMPAVAMSPQGGRAWRAVRAAGDPRGDRGARRDAAAHPGAGIGARHQPRRPPPSQASPSTRCRARRTAASTSRRSRPSSVPRSPRSC